jgi:hypothetical protein
VPCVQKKVNDLLVDDRNSSMIEIRRATEMIRPAPSMMNRSSGDAACAFAFAFSSAFSFVDCAKLAQIAGLLSQERNSISARWSPQRCRRDGRRKASAGHSHPHPRPTGYRGTRSVRMDGLAGRNMSTCKPARRGRRFESVATPRLGETKALNTCFCAIANKLLPTTSSRLTADLPRTPSLLPYMARGSLN